MLTLSSDRKTANSATAGGNARIKNAFGLLSGSANSCPGATSVCERVCYAGKIEKRYKNVHAAMARNFEFVKNNDPETVKNAIRPLIQDFVSKSEKYSAPKKFRIHHDGDFFSQEYAQVWADIAREFPDVQFWAYTRSFTDKCNVVPILAGIDNLALYLSVDSDNSSFAPAILEEFPTVKAATLADTADEAKDLMLSIGRTKPGGACPEVMGKIELITENGGACISCNLCPLAKTDIRFAIKGR